MCCSAPSSPVATPIRKNRSLDAKLASIHANYHGAKDFILADAKDADMAAGLAATGKDAITGKQRSLREYRDQMREITRQGLVDIMLMSASSMESLAIGEKLFDDSTVTPAARANDTTDIHLMAGSSFAAEPSRPFRTATIEQLQSGKVNPTDAQRRAGADLGLYSITPNNRIEFDHPAIEAYKQFRIEAETRGFRHFLEIFDPNACADQCPADLGRYVNDLVARTLAGVPRSGRPIFLKIAYHGPAAMEALAAYDPSLIPGILGGSSGTTHDAFKLLEEAKKYGARAALFGRKINNSEHQLTFVSYLHRIASGDISAAEACKAYHGELQKLKIPPYRALKDDLELTVNASSYAGTSAPPSAARSPGTQPPGTRPPATKALAAKPAPGAAGGQSTAVARAIVARTVVPHPEPGALPKLANGSPDYKNMTAAQKVALSRQRIASDLARAKE